MAEESAAVRVAREYREQLARNEDAALRRMSRYWVQMEKRLSAEFQALAQEVLEREAAGNPVPRQFIYTMERYRSMMEQVRKELPYYQMTVNDIITETQRKNYLLGLDDANAVIKATLPSSDVWTRVYKDAAETVAGFAGDGAPLMGLLQRDYIDTAESIMDSLVSGVGLGKGYRQIAKDMADAMGGDFDRAVRIARTEINRAYRIANAEQYRRSGVVEKVLRLCFKPTACFACLEMDGEECTNGICDDHPNGKCTTVVVTTGGIMPEWEKGADWFEKQDAETQRKLMGAGRYDLWKNEGVDPRSMVYMKPNQVWGGSPTVKTFDMMKEQGLLNDTWKQQAGERFYDRLFNSEMEHRIIGERGKEICPKPIFNRETKAFRENGGIIIQGEDAKRHAEMTGSSAAYIAGGSKVMYLLDDATITEVLEENYHYKQDMRHDHGYDVDHRTRVLREIDAQRHLQEIADRYKIPIDERKETANYLASLLEEAEKYGYL